MNTTTPAIRDLARRLIALGAAREEPMVAGGNGPERACEVLRMPLAKLVGVAGFRSLMSRALTLAKAEVPSLGAVRVRPDGSLEGLNGIGRPEDAEAGTVVMAQLLSLLVTFIGEPLTMRLVHDAWPEEPVVETDRNGEGQS